MLVFVALCLTQILFDVSATGSPFDVNFKNKDTPAVVIPTDVPVSTLPPIFNTSTTEFMATNLTLAEEVAEEKEWKDYISVGLLMFGIIGARCGL